MTEPAPVIQRRVMRAERRFLWVVVLVQTAVIAAMVVVLLLVLRQVRDVEAHDAANNEAHRQRNEQIHACIVAKEDAFRRDIYRLLQTKPGTTPQFPEADGISCPAVKP